MRPDSPHEGWRQTRVFKFPTRLIPILSYITNWQVMTELNFRDWIKFRLQIQRTWSIQLPPGKVLKFDTKSSPNLTLLIGLRSDLSSHIYFLKIFDQYKNIIFSDRQINDLTKIDVVVKTKPITGISQGWNLRTSKIKCEPRARDFYCFTGNYI